MFTYLRILRHRIRNLRRLRRKVWRERIHDILSHYPSEYVKTEDEVLTDLRCLVRTRYPWEIRIELPHYFASGAHMKGALIDDHVCWAEWWTHMSRLHAPKLPEVALINDKRETSQMLDEHGFRVAERLGSFTLPESAQMDIVVTDSDGSAKSLPALLKERGEIFCKPLDTTKGIGCMKLRHDASREGCLMNERFVTWAELYTSCRESISEYRSKALFLAEESVQQHPAISAIYPHSVNTLRLYTLREKDGSISYIGGFIRMGVGGSCVDNTSAGGFCVGIEADGRLMDTGISFDYEVPFPMPSHPDTGLVFKGYELPFFDEAVQLCREAHLIFSQRLLMLAWDIAITPKGPLVIEVNVYGAIGTIQHTHGGLRHVYLNYLLPACEHYCGSGKQG